MKNKIYFKNKDIKNNQEQNNKQIFENIENSKEIIIVDEKTRNVATQNLSLNNTTEFNDIINSRKSDVGSTISIKI